MRILILGLVLLSMFSLGYSVDISSCQTISSSGIYYLTADISNQDGDCFTITTSNVTLDCQGHVIDGDGDTTGYGVYVNAYDYGNISNVTIRNCTVKEFYYGIYFRGGANNSVNESIIKDVNCSYNDDGLHLLYSNNISLKNLTMYMNPSQDILIEYSKYNVLENISLNKEISSEFTPNYGIVLRYSENNMIKNIYSQFHHYYNLYLYYSYFINITNFIGLDTDKYSIRLYYSDNNFFQNITVLNAGRGYEGVTYSGFSLWDSNYNKLYNTNSSYNTGYAISLFDSNYNKIINLSSVSNRYESIDVIYSCNNYFENINVSEKYDFGFYNFSINLENKTFTELHLCNADNSNLINITITRASTKEHTILDIDSTDNSYFNNLKIINGSRGLRLFDSDSNTILNSIFINNSEYAISLLSSSNKIYNNYFNNTLNIGFSIYNLYPNYWNNSLSPGPNIYGGQYIGGNFYANPNGNGYSETCTDSDEDGICDNPYILATNNTDYIPLSKKVFPLNPEIYVGTQRVWNYTGYFKGTVNNIDIKNAILNYISTCTPNSNNRCDVPITTHSDNRARIKISDLNIKYEYINPKYRAYISNTGLKDMNIKKIDIISKNGDVCELYNGLDQIIKGALKIYKGNCTFGCSLFDYALFTSTCGLKDKRNEYRTCKWDEY